MTRNPHNAYRSVQATSCDPAQLLLLLYTKTLSEIQKAILLLQSNPTDPVPARCCLVKAHLGVVELDRTLKFNVLPELGTALHNLYLHVLLLLGEGMSDSKLESLQRAHHLLSELRVTWEQASRKSVAAEAAI